MKNQDIQPVPKIVFFGTSDFAVPALKYLIQNGYHISAVVTQPEKPVGRARVVMPSPIKKAALESHFSVFEPHNLKDDEEFFKSFKHIDPDLCVVVAYGKIIPKKYLDIPRFGFLNIHPSLLPKYRGPSPIQSAIMNGDQETGVSIIRIDEKMDHGPVLGDIKYKMSDMKNYKEIEGELAGLGGELLLESLPKYLSGKIKPQEQDHSKATFTKLLTRHDSRIDWNKKAEGICNQIRALNPEPGTWTIWQGKTLNIKKAELLRLEGSLPNIGVIEKVNNNVVVGTGKYHLILKEIQLEGGKTMDAKTFINGHPSFTESKLD